MYSNCRSIPLYNFIEINETGDLHYLLEKNEEKVTEEELLEAYHTILAEYHKLIGDKDSQKKYELRAEIGYCQSKLNNLIELSSLFEMDFDFEKETLKQIESVCSLYNTAFTKEKLEWSISGITNRLNRKIEEYKLYGGDDEDSESFDTFFIAVCKSYGQKVNKKETTLSEWCSIVNSVKT